MFRELLHKERDLSRVHSLLKLRRWLCAHVLASSGLDQTAGHGVELPGEFEKEAGPAA